MKKQFFLLTLLVALATLLFSCESNENNNEENAIESTNISDLIISSNQLEFDTAPNERFRYNLNLAEGEEASFVSEAENAFISRISGNGIYIYTPEKDFTGTDAVLIRIESEPEPEQEGLIFIVGNVRYVYITLNVEEEEPTAITDTEIQILTGACGTLIYQDNLGDDYESAETALEEIRAGYLTSRCPDNPCFESYYIENVEITTDFDYSDHGIFNDFVDLEFFGVNYIGVFGNGTETQLFSLVDVLDSEGNYYVINWCLD